MKAILFLLLSLLFSLFVIAQNNGQYQENNVLKVEYVSYASGIHTFRVSNKLNCNLLVKVSNDGVFTNHTFTALEERLFTLENAQTSQKLFKAKRENGGECISEPDNGWVELGTPIVLPVQFINVTARKVSKDLVELVFEAQEDIDLKYYNIRVSKDTKTFQNVVVIFPNKIQGRKRYKTLVKLG